MCFKDILTLIHFVNQIIVLPIFPPGNLITWKSKQKLDVVEFIKEDLVNLVTLKAAYMKIIIICKKKGRPSLF